MVKVNLYVNEEVSGSVAAAERRVAVTWPFQTPAVVIVPGKVAGMAPAALDAVFLSGREEKAEHVELWGDKAAVLPATRDVLYISGRAASGEIGSASAETMKQLLNILQQAGGKPEDVVRVKAFLQPMKEWRVVEREIETAFGKLGLPPAVYVDWTSASRSTEIELIAAIPKKENPNGNVSYFTPTGEKPSPVFSRVSRIHGDEIIYIGGVRSLIAGTSDDEVNSVFNQLEEISGMAGSDLKHFAKATYFVSEDSVSQSLNKLRPSYFDPERPPAASKVQIKNVGSQNAGLLIDMIAVPKTN